jgi:transcriptional regulator GlxA family with amidase domain
MPEQLQVSSTLTELVTHANSSVDEVAAALGYSTDGFIRSFFRSVGTTPGQYRIAHRLTTARLLIREGADLADAAFAAGFSDQSHLGRCFLRAFGTTPAAYRAGLVGF